MSGDKTVNLSKRLRLAFLSTASLSTVLTVTALAPINAAFAADDKPLVLEEIVVTADRKNSFSADLVQAGSFRGARQIDTPMTVSVVPDAVLQSQQAQGLYDALRNTAGVSSSQTSQIVYNNLAIRGILVENRGNYRMNGVLPIINLTDLPLEDKDRVEALKGASALYYGFTTPSGIINLTMKRPTEEFGGKVSVFGNQYGGVGGHVDVGGTYGKIGARVNAVLAKVDSGIDHTRGDRSLISGAFDFKPTDDLTFTLDVERMHKQVNEPGVFRFTSTTLPKPTVANPYPTVALPPITNSKINFGPDWAYNRTAETNVLLHGQYKLSDAWSISADAGLSQMFRDRHFNTLEPTNLTTGEGRQVVSLQTAHYKNRTWRTELDGTFATGPLVHEVMLGVAQNIRDQNSPASASATCSGTCTNNFFNPRPGPTEVPIPTLADRLTRINDLGYYFFDRVKYQEWLQILGGVRFSNYSESNVTAGTQTFHATPTSYSYAGVVKPWSWMSVYGTYIQGLESTPAAPSTATNAGQQLPATTSTQKEGGIKVEPFKGFLLQAAYFDINRGSTYVNAANTYVQDGRASYKGVELSATGEVTPDLSIYATATFLKAKQATGAPTVISGTTITPTAVGKRIESTPEKTFSLSGEYRFSEWVPGFAMSAGVYYTGNQAINALNQAFIPSVTLFDLGASYTTELYGNRTIFRINGQNITNKDYFAATGGAIIAKSAPGQVKFSITTEF